VADRTWRPSRRDFVAASAGLALSKWAWAEAGTVSLVNSWTLGGQGDSAREGVSGSKDAILSREGHAIWVGEGADRALRLDGYSVWIEHDTSNTDTFGEGITLSAWVALEAFPVNPAAVVQIGQKPALGLLLDKWGYPQLLLGAEPQLICRADHPVARGRWVHLAATAAPSGKLYLYQDGVLCGQLAGATLTLDQGNAVTLGKWSQSPVVARVFPTGVMNGLLRDVQIFSRALTPGEIKDLVRGSQRRGVANRAWCSSDKQRPKYHALPPRAWTNEPHGLIYWRGEYHLFYQKNANGPYWGNINWGHMTSADLYQWTEQPVALSPEPGPDAEGCWSGSVIDHEGKLALIYTGGDGHRASICLATSDDGVTFTKYQANPVIAAPPEGHNYPEFRDPHVWREGDTYYMIIGSAVKDVGGTALLYRSTDLVEWQYLKPLLVGNKASSGTFWEMPIFVKVGAYHVLIVCEVPGRASYWVGDWKDETFTPISADPQRLELFNHLLSPTPYRAADGRVITLGIIPDQRYPRETWKAGWAHLYSLPRVLSVDSAGRLHQTPLENIRKFSQPLFSAAQTLLDEAAYTNFPGASGTGVEINVQFRRGNSQSVFLLVRRSPDGQEQTELSYAWETGTMTLDRSRSSLNPEVRRDVQTTQYRTDTPGALSLLLYLDESVIEVFVDGRSAFGTRVYPMLEESTGIAAGCIGKGASIEALSVKTVSLSLD
jgi:sucrose-6-phosphate hydrolase SacC (GH32 family)